MMSGDKIDKLRGTMIKKIEVGNNNTSLTIITDDGQVTFKCEADCCSDSWIEHFESPTQPEYFVSFERIGITRPPEISETKIRNPKEMDCVQYYFYKLTTEKGTYMIEMRNNSNGYYGGWLS